MIAIYGMVSFTAVLIPVVIVLVLFLLFLIALFRPYKFSIHNAINISLLFVINLCGVLATIESIVNDSDAFPYHSRSREVLDTFAMIFFITPILFFIGLLLYKCFSYRRCTQRAYQRICALMPCGICRKIVCSGSEESMPDRMIHAEQYVALLAEPVTESEESDSTHE